jgi:hypothetical protein
VIIRATLDLAAESVLHGLEQPALRQKLSRRDHVVNGERNAGLNRSVLHNCLLVADFQSQ